MSNVTPFIPGVPYSNTYLRRLQAVHDFGLLPRMSTST